MGVDQALFAKAIEMGVAEGRCTLDFGKASRFATGLITYKKRWGAEEVEAPSFHYPAVKGLTTYNDETRTSYKAMAWAWRNMHG